MELGGVEPKGGQRNTRNSGKSGDKQIKFCNMELGGGVAKKWAKEYKKFQKEWRQAN